ncbi:Pentatricopeptide repeat [Macleaya cordata]|uniref:Pentatricopeptide repeat n=1 Tax=Macleaya cordata TaxID=56857 RepID=A0A200Q7T4_MACCD|nr:Pentatricopeptide repeat [Macleaya cordata]
MIKTCLIQDTFLVSRIIAFFTVPSTHFSLDHARRVFDQIHHPNQFIWNSMIRGYTQNGASKESLLLFKQMLLRGFSPDNYTYPIVTKACSHLHAVEDGKLLHGQIVKWGFESDMYIMSGVVNFYASCGRVEVARKIFDKMPERDVVAWTSMISSYAQLNHSEESFHLFDEMKREGVEPNMVTIVSLLSACGHIKDLDRGQWLHSYILENKMEYDTNISNGLMNMYSKCGNMSSASEVFYKIPMKNTVSWNVLIGGFTQNGLPVEALTLFHEMKSTGLRPNEITMVGALTACAQLGDLKQGKLLHLYIQENRINYDVFVGNALINMYSKCGDLDGAIFVFRQMQDRDIFSWTALITGYVQGSKFKEALALFQEMQLSGVEPNEVTLVSLLSASSQLGALDQGKLLHAYIEEHNVTYDLCLENALVDMYAKCGCLERALQIFHGMTCRDIFSWNSMIGGLAINGHGKDAINLFSQMQRREDVVPDGVTFMAVLCACTHSGLVHEGYQYFLLMSSKYGITPSIEHYGCVVDLFGKAGFVEQASDFIEKMPVEPNSIIWGSLLSACCVHHKFELGDKVAQEIIKLAPEDDGLYVLISNMYAEAGRWDDVRRVRTIMHSNGIEKSPGCSLIEVDGVVQEFQVRDTTHHQSDMIYMILDRLMLQLSDPDVS